MEAPGSAPPSRVSIRAVVYARSGPRGSRGRVSPTAGPRSPARVAPPRHVAAHLGAAGPLDASAFRPAGAGGARRAAAVIGRTSSSAVRTSRWTCSSKTGPRRRSASIAPHGLESVRDDGDAGGAAVGRLAFDLRRNGSDGGGGLPRALLNFGSGSSHCPLRGCPCYATSATMLSGGASASKTPTRESSLQIAARDGKRTPDVEELPLGGRITPIPLTARIAVAQVAEPAAAAERAASIAIEHYSAPARAPEAGTPAVGWTSPSRRRSSHSRVGCTVGRGGEQRSVSGTGGLVALLTELHDVQWCRPRGR